MEDHRIPKVLFKYNPAGREIQEDHRRDGNINS